MAENNRRNKRGRSAKGIFKPFAVVARYLRFGSNILQYAKLMAQPHDWVEPLPRSEWTKTCCDPGDASILELQGAVPVTLRRPAQPESVPA
jgi:hypothetical protein